MIGVVLAAGASRRLRPLTDGLPKALLPVRDERSILELAIANLAAVGMQTVAIVTGYAAERIHEKAPALARDHGVEVELIANAKAETWNNAYSLWCAREAFAEGALLVNGDTVHPSSVEEALLAASRDGVALAVDDDQTRLTDESMKVVLGAREGGVARLSKAASPSESYGEYIGVACIHPDAGVRLAESLERTWRRDPQLYYEDGFVEYVRAGGSLTAVPIGPIDWIEVDDHDDLRRARELACRY